MKNKNSRIKVSRFNIIGFIFILLLLPLSYWFSKSSYFSAFADVMPYNTRVYGKVINDNGDPIGGVKIEVYADGVFPKGETKPDGTFSFMVRAPLDCALRFTHPEHIPLEKFMKIPINTQYNVGTVVMQHINPVQVIYGRVTTQLGNGLGGAEVTFTQIGNNYQKTATTNDHGDYTTGMTPMPYGRYHIWVYHPALDPITEWKIFKEVNLERNQKLKVDFQVKILTAAPRPGY